MTTIGERTKYLIEHEKLTEYSFSKRINKSNTAVVKIVKGESKPGYEMLEAIFQEFPDLNREWYLEGIGDIWKSKSKPASDEADSYLRDHLKRLEENFATLTGQLQIKDQQIISLTRMLEQALGKPKVVFFFSGSARPIFFAQKGALLGTTC